MLTIDGLRGEGGGQVLRTSLALSAALHRPFRLEHLRAGRRRPGLMRQHLTAVRAAAEISGAEVSGDELGSTEIEFKPQGVRAGDYRFAVGSAGSAMLVLQTVLPPPLLASGNSTLELEGGTHNPMAPPFDFLERSFLPQLARMGARVELELVRPGFYPAGGGLVRARITPVSEPQALELTQRGAAGEHTAEVLLANLPLAIATREKQVLRKHLGWTEERLTVRECHESRGPGNVVSVTLPFEHVVEVLSAFGEKGLPAVAVARRVALEARRYLASDAPVGEHLADQLMVPMALLAGGSYRTFSPTPHSRTNAEVVGLFLEGAVTLQERGADDCLVRVRGVS